MGGIGPDRGIGPERETGKKTREEQKLRKEQELYKQLGLIFLKRLKKKMKLKMVGAKVGCRWGDADNGLTGEITGG